MSRKYDFGYELEKGSTNEWAYNQISENSVVLELGAAIGNLTKHLKENKNCVVDIVEIDTESGTMASEFARNALLGDVDGNLNTDAWYQQLMDERYDYVVILDVLEHLDDPQRALGVVKKVLKDTGKVVTSIPNVSNNAVLVNLFNDKFEYTELGLLDRTHRYFMTYNTILEMTEKLGYNIDSIDAISKDIGTSEIPNSYEDVPEEVAYFLKTRKLGAAYQYLLILGKEELPTDNRLSRLEKTGVLYTSLVLFNGLSDEMLHIQNEGEKIDIQFEIPSDKSVDSIRFVPMEHACMIKGLKAAVRKENGEEVEICPNWTGGIELEDGGIILLKAPQEINWMLDGDEQSMTITCECTMLLHSMLPYFDSCMATIRQENEKIASLEESSRSMEEASRLQIAELKEANLNLHRELDQTTDELQSIKNTKWYKVISKLKRVGREG
ncbi:MAG: class I SAM-dependent methyltransferase [Roseburia sp.]|nr:class I SAM-dependent methyltransferase [Roseburia sp.]